MTHRFFKGKDQRRAIRRSLYAESLADAIRKEATGWDHLKRLEGGDQPQNLRGVIASAIQKTEALLGQFNFPRKPEITYTRVKDIRTGARDRQAVMDGCVMLQAKFATLSGVRSSVVIPVMIKEGKVIDPSVFI